MVSLGRIYKCGKRRNGFCTCGSEVLAAKSVREVKLRVSGVARRPRFQVHQKSNFMVAVNWYGAGRPLVCAQRPLSAPECETVCAQRPPSTPGCEAVRAQRP
ncbi:hypothetical protein LR48_Vigan10g045400 [Vigna angularis]|uniref:Uncharacterized protein n=1 Tax=Phaseolus angularis TaxID=3914 RepID=A0A0L9VI44_PHAAN|nr:hypothetical protein LR48_Vigan10g045400 [Vigna angularis]